MEQALTTAPASPALRLQPQAAPAVYEALIKWEAYANGDYQVSDIRKVVAVQVRRAGPGYAIEFSTSPPQLTKPEDLESLEQLALRLAGLYARVVVEADRTGHFTGLLNHEELRQTWARLSADLRAMSLPGDEVTGTLLGFLDRQLQSSAQFLESLGYDYLYQALLPAFYEQPLGQPGVTRPRWFPKFFDKVPLCFAERVAVRPDPTAGQLALELTGTLDTTQTDVAAVQAQITQALGGRQAADAPASPAAEVPAPHFGYQATYELSPATGLPERVELTAYARAGLLFNKQYTLTLTRQ